MDQIVSVDVVHASVVMPPIGGTITINFSRTVSTNIPPTSDISIVSSIPYGYYADSYSELISTVHNSITSAMGAAQLATEIVLLNNDNQPHQYVLGGTATAVYGNTNGVPTIVVSSAELASLLGWPISTTIAPVSISVPTGASTFATTTQITLPYFSSISWPRSAPMVYISVPQLPTEHQTCGSLSEVSSNPGIQDDVPLLNDSALVGIIATTNTSPQSVTMLRNVTFAQPLGKISRLDLALSDSYGNAYSANRAMVVLDITCLVRR
jgi:hypothetical protein